MKEHAPWYEIAGRILLALTISGISYAALFLNLCAAIVIYDAITGKNLQGLVLNLCEQYPTGSIVITVIGYIVWTVYLAVAFVNRLTGRK